MFLSGEKSRSVSGIASRCPYFPLKIGPSTFVQSTSPRSISDPIEKRLSRVTPLVRQVPNPSPSLTRRNEGRRTPNSIRILGAVLALGVSLACYGEMPNRHDLNGSKWLATDPGVLLEFTDNTATFTPIMGEVKYAIARDTILFFSSPGPIRFIFRGDSLVGETTSWGFRRSR